MISTGFHWGTKPSPTDVAKPFSSNASGKLFSKKRRFLDLTPTSSSTLASASASTPPSASTRKTTRKPSSPNKFKKSRTPRILGQALPLNRLIEVLDHASLQGLLQDLIQMHPEIASTVNKLSPKPTITNSINLLKEKFDIIIKHLPYKCDVESDYSYLRIKPHMTEFLNCLSDFILNFLPPMELNVVNSLTFLDLITHLIHELPNFTNNEFQYTKLMAYEQIANTWLIVLNQNTQIEDDETSTSNSNEDTEHTLKLYKIIKDMKLEEKIDKHNEYSWGKFKTVADFIKSELDQAELIDHALNNANNQSGLSDFITLDYSNYSITARTSH